METPKMPVTHRIYNYSPFRDFCVDDAEKYMSVLLRPENNEFYRGAKALWTFSVSEVKEACRFLTDFAKIHKTFKITRLGIN